MLLIISKSTTDALNLHHHHSQCYVGLMSAALLTVNGTSLSHEGGIMFVLHFIEIPYHSTILLSFFLLLFFAAWTSAISLLEPIVLTLSNQFNIERKVMAWIMALIIWVVGALCCLYPSWFNNIRTFSTDLMLPLGALGYMIFTGWKLDRNLIQTHLHQNRWLWFMIQFIVPVLIIGILTLHSFLCLNLFQCSLLAIKVK